MQKTSTADYICLHVPTVHSWEMPSSLYMIQKPGENKQGEFDQFLLKPKLSCHSEDHR